MNKLISVVKLFLNIVMFLVYALLAIIIWDFLYWLYMVRILNYASSTWAEDPNHLKIAIVSVIFILIFSLIFRKFFYLEVFKDEDELENKKTKKEKLEIYVNKEIKK